MKLLLATLIILLSSTVGYSQLTWSSGIPPNTDYDNQYSPMETVMYNNDVYQVSDSAGSYIEITRYNSKTGQWIPLSLAYNPNGNYGFRTAIIGDVLYILSYGSTQITSYKYNFTTQTFNFCPGALTTITADSWITKFDSGSNQFYVAYIDNNTDVHLAVFDTGAEQFTDFNYTSVLNTSGTNLSSAQIELYLGNTDIYIGVSGTINRLCKAPVSNPGANQYYNVSGTNDGYLRLNSTLLINGFYYLTGDGQGAPYVTVQDPTNYIGYEEQLTTADVNINTSSATANTFYTNATDHEALEHSAYAFLVSPFSNASDGTNYNKFYVYRKDNGNNVWDSLGPKIEFGLYDLTPYSLRLSLENSNQQHISVKYASSNGMNHFKVLNNKPSVVTASQTISSGLCGGHNNLIYPQLEIEDADRDYIRILSVSSTNGYVQNCYATPIGVDNSSSPGISKFAIYGFVQTQGNTQIIVTYTDGWNIFTDTLNSIAVVGNAPNIVFDPALSHLCNNENHISLSDYVNYVDNGEFSINGQVVPNGVINGIEYYTSQPSGSVNYTVNVAGCIVSTGTSYNFVAAGIASATTTPATCGNLDGTATATYTAGSSSTFTVEWTTGETASTINNLHSGAYYYNITDGNGCHATGLASVTATTIQAVETIWDVTCNGAHDGQLYVDVTGPANYSVIWSNGYSTPTISNLAGGTYWVTIRDLDNSCEATYAYTVGEPAKITATFSGTEPTCGNSDGNIYGTYSGGFGATYMFEWLNTTQTTADLYNVPYGYYEVKVMDGNNCTDTFSYQLDNQFALDIAAAVTPTSCQMENGAISTTLSPDPNGGTAYPTSISWSNGFASQSIGNLASGYYTIHAVNTMDVSPFTECHSMKTVFVPIKAPIAQQICLVTVDTATTTNLVVWSRSESFGIHHYNIYRENTVAGEFSLIDTVLASNLCVFNDVVASPLDKSWRYRVSQVDECGIESPISIAHKTLHLSTIDVLADQSVDIFWDEYEGNIDAANYIVWRFTDQAGWENVGSTAIGVSTYNDVPPAGITGLDYFIEMVLQTPCDPQKAQDFNTTRSNKDKGTFKVGEGTGNSNNELSENSFSYEIYPNPVTDALYINITENGIGQILHVYSPNGQELKTIAIHSANQSIDLESLAQGMYYLHIDGSPTTLSIIKN